MVMITFKSNWPHLCYIYHLHLLMASLCGKNLLIQQKVRLSEFFLENEGMFFLLVYHHVPIQCHCSFLQ